MPQKKSKAYRKVQNEIDVLKKQLNNSRCAVDNITNTRIDAKFRENIESLQSQLQNCITTTNIQMTKNKVLSQLVFCLQMQQQNNEDIRKSQSQSTQARIQRQINIQMANVDRIIKKFNEETAKINELKIMVNSNRSQRVVCSNMLKKLEKEIKQYEELYKNQLLISQAFKRKSKKAWSFEKNLMISRIPSIVSNHKQDCYVEYGNKYYEQQSDNSCGNLCPQKNRVQIKQVSGQNSPKFHSLRDSKQKDPMRKTAYKEQKLKYTKQLLQKITLFGTLIEQINVNGESGNSKQLINRYQNITEENSQILQNIGEIDIKLSAVQDKVRQVKKQMKSLQFSEGKLQNADDYAIASGKMLGFHVNSFKLIDQDVQTNSIIDILEQVADILSTKMEKNNKGIPTTQSIQTIDQNIQKLRKYSSCLRSVRPSEQNKRVVSETVVSCLLDRMQKFTQCDKIMDGNLLKEEYYKELGTKSVKVKKQYAK